MEIYEFFAVLYDLYYLWYKYGTSVGEHGSSGEHCGGTRTLRGTYMRTQNPNVGGGETVEGHVPMSFRFLLLCRRRMRALLVRAPLVQWLVHACSCTSCRVVALPLVVVLHFVSLLF